MTHISRHNDPKSASKTDVNQMIALKVLFKYEEIKRLPAKVVAYKDRIDDARAYLNGRRAWNEYLDAVDEFKTCQSVPYVMRLSDTLGPFFHAVKLQLMVRASSKNIPEPEEPETPGASSNYTVSMRPVTRSITAVIQEDGPKTPTRLPKASKTADLSEQFSRGMSLSGSQDGHTASSAICSDASYSNYSNEHGSEIANLESPAEAESFVNNALIAFLGAITDGRPEDMLNWLSAPKAFHFKYGKDSKTQDKAFEARTDGYLLGKVSTGFWAIIECKARRRYLNSDGAKIRMQESSQMAAWISYHWDANKEPKGLTVPGDLNQGTYSRILISQDRDRIYLIIAEFDDGYRKYICGDSTTDLNKPEDFLVMNEYGPFKTKIRSDMEALGLAIVVLNMEAGDREEEQRKKKKNWTYDA
ncbi:hypothetical protein MMC25_007988 [Agyrium rufum]|nr:hypothetical protein [Agyrium rufum]